MKRHICLICSCTILSLQIVLTQNVGINPAGTTPNSSSILDLNTGNTFTNPNGKGLIVPNVALTATNAANPVSGPATSLLVYNTATAGASPNNVVPGYYYWDGAKWVAIGGNGSLNWSLTGNAGTTVGTNFLGTTDNVDLQFNVNNSRSGLIDIASYETFFGYQAGLSTTGILNTFIGYQSGKINTTGTGNTGIGYNSIQANISGTDNSAIGVQTLYYTTGSSNVALGTNAGFSVNSGSGNTALGFWAMNNSGLNNISGSNNTSVGNQAGSTITSGSYNSHFGFLSGMAAGTYTNSTAIGAYSQAGANDVLILGSIAGVNTAATSVKVGIGTTTPTALLHLYLNDPSVDVWSSGATNGLRITNANTTNGSYSNIKFNTVDAGGSSKLISQIASVCTNHAVGVVCADLTFGTTQNGGLVEWMRITSAGLVGIATQIPSAQLSVNGAANNTTGVWGIFSDARIKTINAEFKDGLEIIKKINPVKFTYNSNAPFQSDKEQIGIVAQELEKIAPYMVSQKEYGQYKDLREVNNQAYVFLLINSVKELNGIVVSQKQEIDVMKERLVFLEKMMEKLTATGSVK